MPKFDIIRLEFVTPLHIGNERNDQSSGQSVIQSDSITAAIHHSWYRLGHPEWIPQSSEEGSKFVISSMYPYAFWEGKRLLFLPRPILPTRHGQNSSEDVILRKKMKKVKWVDKDVFSTLTSGLEPNTTIENIRGDFLSSHAIRGNSDHDGKELPPFIQGKVFPRSRVSRFGEENTVIFYIERFFFNEGSGLYGIVFYESETVRERVETGLRFLADEGIGTDRNVGHGKFKPFFGESIEFREIPDGEYCINLGLYCPKDSFELENLINDRYAGYELTRRGGWLSEPFNTWRKKSIYMFKEGSCFFRGKGKEQFNTMGHMVDLRPSSTVSPLQHPVWRSGISLFVPCK
jgi:CRISPR type III-A-associated RAMP protein Csm4